jgi:hypothetical protein
MHITTISVVSPQFHVVFDDKFSRVKCLHASSFYVDEDFAKTNLLL